MSPMSEGGEQVNQRPNQNSQNQPMSPMSEEGEQVNQSA